jgi:hypothetical protein
MQINFPGSRQRLSAILRRILAAPFVDFFASVALLLLVMVLYCQFFPKIHDVQYQRGKDAQKNAELPLSFESNGQDLTVSFHVKISPFHPRVYSVLADDCISAFRIDGQPINVRLFGQCKPDVAVGHVFLTPLLPPGEHSIDLRITDAFGREGFDFRPSTYDPLLIGMQLLIMGLVGACFFFLWRILGLKRWGLFTVLLIGIVLRIAYFDVTPYNVRVHDVDGHIEYVRWLLEHRSLPHSDKGWEFFQPPLYYVLSAASVAVSMPFASTRSVMIWVLQFQSLILSIAVLLASAWLAVMLFPPDPGRRKRSILFLALIATTPTLVASASQINNDALVQLLAFLSIGLLIRFWRTGRQIFWFALIALVSLGILTKLNMLLFLPVAYLCLFFHGQVSFRRKIFLGFVTVFLVLSFTEWFYILKYCAETTSFPIGNVSSLGNEIALQNTPAHLLWFHPVRFVSIPYINVISDISGRQYFWEYLLKTAILGEFGYAPILFRWSQALLLVTLLIVPLSVIGFFRSIINRIERFETFPLFCLVVVLLSGHMAFRLHVPFVCSQDFRYSVGLFVPAFAFAITGLRAFPPKLRVYGEYLLWAFAGLSMVFTLLIYLFQV